MRAALAFAAGFVVWQPFGYWLSHLLPSRAHAITTSHDWVVFELEVAALGAVAGVWWYYTRQALPRTWMQYWADWGIGALALVSLICADQSTTAPWFVWIPLPIVSAALVGGLLGSVALYVARSINSPRTG